MKAAFTTVVLLYLVLDFGSPCVPGAVSFDVADSVEMARAQRAPSTPLPLLALTPEPFPGDTSAHSMPQRVSRERCADLGIAPAPLHAARRLAPDPSGPEEG